ncbi:methionine/alanine import family NSS transporter small subunit [Phycicoccus sp. BSK3Z-2]|uniref:Methionine/alanine import family NSS transporter small subunit n=1 Tax=Phycicoccus avicenniae TaxID=2828860 RepID=A0A941HZB9_9MICO|nr:methionine/alanine import family NSS transporter small subunit [Phycicoccus avicenniae]MBR7742760.1 methionine/alanine import family NSS transporter small subunit [Phycicoccus avicenniae]
MSGGAVVMMIVAMLVLWGGLGLAVWNLTRRGDTGGAGGTDGDPDWQHRDL